MGHLGAHPDSLAARRRGLYPAQGRFSSMTPRVQPDPRHRYQHRDASAATVERILTYMANEDQALVQKRGPLPLAPSFFFFATP